MLSVDRLTAPGFKSKPPIQHALQCAARGWAVFPASLDKTPRTPNGHKAASTDPERIRAMAVQFGFVLVGIATGEASGIAVLDIDRQHNGLEWWQDNRHRLPATRTHRTRSGGLHLLFKHQPGLRCSTSLIAPGIDIKAEGGAIIYWPATGLEVLCDAPMAEWPAWLTPAPKPATVTPWQPLSRHDGNKARNYAAAALERAVRRVAGTTTGSRNSVLNAETFSLARFIPSGALAPAEIAEAMAHAGFAAGLDAAEIAATLASALGSAAR
ncbi:MAG TPA: bifunctional DNA primase/polymerase [Halothiobacillus sp.]|nr:bifunctional DNA primase/polymerase [Halothiobacillus sp.]